MRFDHNYFSEILQKYQDEINSLKSQNDQLEAELKDLNEKIGDFDLVEKVYFEFLGSSSINQHYR